MARHQRKTWIQVNYCFVFKWEYYYAFTCLLYFLEAVGARNNDASAGTRMQTLITIFPVFIFQIVYFHSRNRVAVLHSLCSAISCYAMLCYAMLCYAMLCYAMLCSPPTVTFLTERYESDIDLSLYWCVNSVTVRFHKRRRFLNQFCNL